MYLKFEKLSKVELVCRRRRVGHVTDEDVSAQLLHLVLYHVVDGPARHQLWPLLGRRVAIHFLYTVYR